MSSVKHRFYVRTVIDLLFPFFVPPSTWLSSAGSHLITPNASRATTPVGDMEAFDPSHPSVSPDESILLPIGKVPSYLDTALKALSLHTEARNSFITYVCTLPLSSNLRRLIERIRNQNIQRNSTIAAKSWDAAGLVDIGYQICSSMNMSPCVSLRRRRTRRQRRCTSRPCLMSSPVSSWFSAAFHQPTWEFGRPRPRAWRRRMARRSGRRLSESNRCARRIVACSAFWSGAGWKLSNAHVLVMDIDIFYSHLVFVGDGTKEWFAHTVRQEAEGKRARSCWSNLGRELASSNFKRCVKYTPFMLWCFVHHFISTGMRHNTVFL